MHSIINKSMEENQITGFQLSLQPPTQSCSFFFSRFVNLRPETNERQIVFRFFKFSDPNLKNGKFLYKNHCFWLLLNKLEDLVTPCLVSLHETMGCCPHFINGVGVRVPFEYTLGPDSYLLAQSPAWPPCSFLGLLLPTSDGFI